jgi:protein-tyrosine-phosphatase
LFYSADLDTTEDLIGYLALDVGRARPDLLAPLLSAQKDTAAMRDTDFDVLFICSGNSARSIFAEALLRDLGKGKFQAFSAGTRPGSELNPFALEILKRNGHDVTGLRAKHLSEFQQPDSIKMDFVFTVCDQAAAEPCPYWPGQPMTAHWGVPDPAAAEGNEAERRLAFADAYRMLRNRITIFVNLPLLSINRLKLQERLDEIGKTPDSAPA